VERYLLAAADQQEKIVLGLESAEYQVSLFDSMSDSEQERYMLEHLSDMEDGISLTKTRGLIDAWSAADPSKIEHAMAALTTGDSVSSTFLQRTLLDKRNPEMVKAIENIMRDERSAFIGVGLLHMIGSKGLPQLLSQRGYLVEKIY
jgi:hypothetical protein